MIFPIRNILSILGFFLRCLFHRYSMTLPLIILYIRTLCHSCMQEWYKNVIRSLLTVIAYNHQRFVSDVIHWTVRTKLELDIHWIPWEVSNESPIENFLWLFQWCPFWRYLMSHRKFPVRVTSQISCRCSLDIFFNNIQWLHQQNNIQNRKLEPVRILIAYRPQKIVSLMSLSETHGQKLNRLFSTSLSHPPWRSH